MAATEIGVYTQTYINVFTVIVYILQYIGYDIIKCDLFIQAAEHSQEGLSSTLKG